VGGLSRRRGGRIGVTSEKEVERRYDRRCHGHVRVISRSDERACWYVEARRSSADGQGGRASMAESGSPHVCAGRSMSVVGCHDPAQEGWSEPHCAQRAHSSGANSGPCLQGELGDRLSDYRQAEHPDALQGFQDITAVELSEGEKPRAFRWGFGCGSVVSLRTRPRHSGHAGRHSVIDISTAGAPSSTRMVAISTNPWRTTAAEMSRSPERGVRPGSSPMARVRSRRGTGDGS